MGITHSFLSIDIDYDGDLDIITRSAVGQVYVYKNNENINHAININLIDNTGNRNAIGAKIYIEYGDGKKQIRELTLGGGFMSYQIPSAHFGLQKYKNIQKLKIRWPDGIETVIDSTLNANYTYVIERMTK